MHVSVGLPTDRVHLGDEFTTGTAVGELARAFETCGYHACFVTDHPYPDDRFIASGGHHALDPLIALTYAAAVTERLRLHTNIFVLAYRNPFISAKAIASLDVLSEGRVILGVATGYLKREFQALGVDLERRNELTDAALDAIKRAWTEDGLHLEGDGWLVDGHSMRPKPAQQPHPPIWIGGNSKQAIRRAVDHAQGWMPFPTPPGVARSTRTAAIESTEDLAERLTYLRSYAAEQGRTDPLTICFSPLKLTMFGLAGYDPAELRDELDALGELGVTWINVVLPGETRADFLGHVERFADHVLRR